MSTDGVSRHHAAPAEATTSAIAVRIVNLVKILVPEVFILISLSVRVFHFIYEAGELLP